MHCPNAIYRSLAWLTPRRLLPAGIAITLAIVVVAGLVVMDTRRDTMLAANREADNVAAAMAQDIASTIELYDLMVQAVVHDLQFPGFAALDPDLRHLTLFDRAANAHYLGFINVLNEAGDVIADSRSKTPRPANFGGRDYFQFHRREPLDQLHIGRPFLTGPDQPATIPLSRRISQPDGSFAGVVVAGIRLAYFHELFGQVALGAHATIALFRDDGVLLMRLPFNQDDVGRTVAPNSPLFATRTGGATRIEVAEAGDPVRRSYAFHHAGELPLTVAVGLADEDIYAPWRHKAALIMGTVVALCVLLLGVIVRLSLSLTQQARAEAGMRRANEDMANFVATISHELRTPLTSILGYAELLSWEGQLAPEHIGFVAAIVSAGKHMSHVVKRMLEVPRPAALSNPPEPRDTDLDKLIEECRNLVELNARRKKLRLACRVDPDLPRSAILDPGQVRQVLVNLLTNAIKYTETGTVDLRVSRSQARLRFEVTDTGPGIPVGKRARLFTARDRLGAEQGPIEGSGLGLWAVDTLVKGMGGEAGYADNPAGGSIFWVEIPVGAPASAPPEPMSRTTSVEEAEPSPRHILLVDDIALNRQLVGHFLRSGGHTFVEACDGVEAVQQAMEADFDLVLMDIRMPRMDGVEATRRIRALAAPHGQVPIVAMTADNAPSHQDRFRDAGINRHLPKPFTCDELLCVVDEMATQSGRPPVSVTPKPRPDPEAVSKPTPVLDVEVLEQLASRMSTDNIEAYLCTLQGRIDDLVKLLQQPHDEALGDLVHEMQGSAGFLGFAALVAALRGFERTDPAQADDRERQAAGLLAVAEQSRQALRQRLTDPDAESAGKVITGSSGVSGLRSAP